MFCFSVYKYLFGNRFPLIVHYHLIIQISSGLDIPGDLRDRCDHGTLYWYQ